MITRRQVNSGILASAALAATPFFITIEEGKGMRKTARCVSLDRGRII
jgi:hypothetical protein